MTFPVWIGVGSWRVHPHLFFELVAYAVATAWYIRDRRRLGDHLSIEARWSLAAAAVAGAVIGSRVLFWLEDPQRTLGHLTDVQYLIGGQTIVGGLTGGWLAVEWQKRRLGLHEPTGDLFAIPIALGAAVGRIGCFLSGLPDGTYGLETALPWGVDLGDGVPRHPVALYESIFLLGLAWGLSRLRARSQRGDTFLALIAAYLAFRVIVDFLKPGVRLALGLTAIQWAAVAGLVIAWRVYSRRHSSKSLRSD